MTAFLRQSTAETVTFGPFVDSTDGVTAETGLTISQADIRLSKNGAAFAQTNNAAGATHMENGYYSVPLNTTDTNTLGRLRVSISESGALPVWRDFMVVPANVWDSLFGSDKLQVHVDEMTAGIITAAVIATDAVDADALADNAITAATFAADAITAAKLAGDVATEIQNGLATASALTTLTNYVDTEVSTILNAVDTEVAAIKAVTDALTSAAAAKLALSAGTIIVGNAVTGTLSTTQMTTDLTEATDNHYNGRIIIWTSGVLIGQATDIVDYDGTTKMLTFTAITEAPSDGDDFIIV